MAFSPEEPETRRLHLKARLDIIHATVIHALRTHDEATGERAREEQHRRAGYFFINRRNRASDLLLFTVPVRISVSPSIPNV